MFSAKYVLAEVNSKCPVSNMSWIRLPACEQCQIFLGTGYWHISSVKYLMVEVAGHMSNVKYFLVEVTDTCPVANIT